MSAVVALSVSLVTGEKVIADCARQQAEQFVRAVALRQFGGLVVPGTEITVRVEHIVKATIA